MRGTVITDIEWEAVPGIAPALPPVVVLMDNELPKEPLTPKNICRIIANKYHEGVKNIGGIAEIGKQAAGYYWNILRQWWLNIFEARGGWYIGEAYDDYGNPILNLYHEETGMQYLVDLQGNIIREWSYDNAFYNEDIKRCMCVSAADLEKLVNLTEYGD